MQPVTAQLGEFAPYIVYVLLEARKSSLRGLHIVYLVVVTANTPGVVRSQIRRKIQRSFTHEDAHRKLCDLGYAPKAVNAHNIMISIMQDRTQ